jgi:hypothetical protein
MRLTIIGAALGSILSIQAMATDYIYKVAYPAIALCPEQADVQKLFQLINAGDVPSTEIAAFANASRCLILREGAVVHMTDLTFWSGLAKVRPEGQVHEFWTYKSMITRVDRP